jgi:putative ABC transport system permease protein
MVKNYLITVWRNLIKSKAHSLTNVTGLSIGMAAARLVGFWIRRYEPGG